MTAQTLLLIIIALTALSAIFGQVLAALNIAKPRQDIDPRLAGLYDAERYAKSLTYQADKTRFGLAMALFATALNVSLFATGAFGRWADFLSARLDSPILQALAFFGSLYLATDLLSLPFQLYGTFRLEARYGFNRTTLTTFIGDKLKGWLLTAILGGGAVSGLIALVGWLGSGFWLVCAGLALLVMLLVNMFYTSLIVPLFNKLRPLPAGELKSAIEAYASGQNFSLAGIFVIDASKRSSKSNAYFSGLGPKKKIVLYDTLIEKHSIPELVAVLAHEIGHYRHGHILRAFIGTGIQVTLTLWLFSLFVGNRLLSAALGAEHYALHLNVLAFGLLFSPISTLTGLLSVITSRRHEFQADAFAARTTSPEAMGSALKRLSVDNLSYLYPHPAFVFFNYSH
ncbi:MAG: hypothetical protein A2Y32_06210, partial [Spirochaetes bacterium GWF1_60_12]